jgi:hypothetical protein
MSPLPLAPPALTHWLSSPATVRECLSASHHPLMCTHALPPAACPAAPCSAVGHCHDPRQCSCGQEDPNKPHQTGTVFNPASPHGRPTRAGLTYHTCAQWSSQRCTPCVVRLAVPDRPSYRLGPCTYIRPFVPLVHPRCQLLLLPVRLSVGSLFFSPSRPPWTGCLTTPCGPFSGPTEAP